MPQYALLMYQPTGPGPSPEEYQEEQPRWAQFQKDLQASGLLVDNHGLAGTDVATTVRVRDGETQVTDGPFAETKEYLAGIVLLDAPDLDAALELAAKVPSAAYGSVEVRPLWGASA